MSGVNLIKKLSANSALVGAGLAVGAGLLLWGTPLGEPWENISYDCLFNFGARPVTNQVVIVQMDLNNRNTLRERGQHAQLLDKLTDDGARLVVFDVHFQGELDSKTDEALAGAMRRNGHVVLMGDVSSQSDDHLDSASVDLPLTNFLAAAAGCGVGRADAPTGQVARRHWPFRAPGEGHFHSLGWVTAELFGARLDRKVEKQWLRYYGRTGPGERLPYAQALAATPGFFRGKIIFIGGWPQRPNDPGEPEPDKFLTPYSGWSGQAIGGIEINATTFLNLVNGDWLRRPKLETEFLLIVGAGILLGGGLCRLRPLPALLVALGVLSRCFYFLFRGVISPTGGFRGS